MFSAGSSVGSMFRNSLLPLQPHFTSQRASEPRPEFLEPGETARYRRNTRLSVSTV